ncbi:MAG TPA: ribosome maturation factor RimM [Ilumatobacter sp.]|nr:ribosome maturation factor RimM [Ilumatobacter sp.]
MSVPEGLLEVGRIGRAHGVRGDVFIDLTTDRSERVAVGARLFARDRWYTVSQSHRSNRRWRVHLDGVDERSAAEALAGTVLHAEPIDDPDALWIHQLIGAAVVEVDGTPRGRCVSVIDNPAADVLELDTGALVPANFVTAAEHTDDGVVVTIDPPDGLFELYDS